MGKIKKINLRSKGFLVSFLGEVFDVAVKVFDGLDLTEHDGLLAAFPFGKVVGFFVKKGIVIDCDLSQTEGLTIQQLSLCKTLKGCKLPPWLDSEMRERYPQLFE